jgi:hypothetical protein
MMQNDRLGDCTCVGVGHLIQDWTANNGAEFTPTDNQILSLYEAVSGYNAAPGANDNGAYCTTVPELLETERCSR